MSMNNIIKKLNILYYNTQCRGTTLPSMLKEIADFIEEDLTLIMDQLDDLRSYVEELEEKIKHYETHNPINGEED
jgi:hypothetical protein